MGSSHFLVRFLVSAAFCQLTQWRSLLSAYFCPERVLPIKHFIQEFLFVEQHIISNIMIITKEQRLEQLGRAQAAVQKELQQLHMEEAECLQMQSILLHLNTLWPLCIHFIGSKYYAWSVYSFTSSIIEHYIILYNYRGVSEDCDCDIVVLHQEGHSEPSQSTDFFSIVM